MGERGRQEDEYGRGAEEGASRSKLRGGGGNGDGAICRNKQHETR